jgi:hypothetical protein
VGILVIHPKTYDFQDVLLAINHFLGIELICSDLSLVFGVLLAVVLLASFVILVSYFHAAGSD